MNPRIINAHSRQQAYFESVERVHVSVAQELQNENEALLSLQTNGRALNFSKLLHDVIKA